MPSCCASFISQRARDLISFPLSPKRLLSFPWVRTLLCPSVHYFLWMEELFVSWNEHICELKHTYPFSDIIGKVVIIPMELSSGKFLLINFARSKYFGGEFCLTDKKQFFQTLFWKFWWVCELKIRELKVRFLTVTTIENSVLPPPLPTNYPAYYWEGFVYLSSDQIDLTPNILASMITTTCLPPPLPPTASTRWQQRDWELLMS
jgi:hypothetical protein